MEMLAMHLTLLRKRTGLTRKQLGERVGVGETTIKNIETGYTVAPPFALVEKLSAVFNVNTDGLLGNTHLEIGEKSRAVYVADSISASKPFVEIEKIVDTIFMDRDDLLGYDYIGLRIKDNAMMNSRICDGDTVLVRKNAIVRNGDIVVAVYGEHDAVVRRYFCEGEKVTLRADAPGDVFSDIVVDTEKERFILIGKVIRCLFSV